MQNQKSLDASTVDLDGGRQARIALRRTRIEQNRASKLKSDSLDEQFARRVRRVEIESSKSKLQIDDSIKITASIRAEGIDNVNQVKVGIEEREATRQSMELRNQGKWQERELAEKQASKEIMKIIDSSWDKAERLSGPFKLDQLLKTQKEACKKALDIKDGLIGEYLTELKIKDEEYVRELKRQSEEIDKLLEKMNAEFKIYENGLIKEAEKIEQAFVQERSDLIQSNYKEVHRLLQARKANEFKYMDDKGNRIEDCLNQLDRLRVSDSEDYNLLKIKLETEIQLLEQQLSQMRVTYLLNQEKLEYNYQVLKKREEENGNVIGAQKRKINRLAEQLNHLKVKSAKQDKILHQENSNLVDDLNNLNHQYTQVFKKFGLFQQADATRYKEIWKMNEEEARIIMERILMADKIIHTQQLGMKWQFPSEDLFKDVDPLAFQGSPIEFGDELKEVYEGSLANKYLQLKSQSEIVKNSLFLLCQEARFLVNDNVQSKIFDLSQDDQLNLLLDSIFKALGVHSVEDVDLLLSFLVTESSNTLIAPYEVLAAVKKYSALKEEGSGTLKSAADSLTDIESTNASKQKLLKEHWTRMENVLDEKCFRTWNAICKSMATYNKILNERWQKLQKIEGLEKQNGELKQLLRNYLSSKLNDDFQVPPSQILLAQAGMLR